MNVSDATRLKRAVRKFTDQPLPEEAILAILNAGQRVHSFKNTHQWLTAASCQADSVEDRVGKVTFK